MPPLRRIARLPRLAGAALLIALPLALAALSRPLRAQATWTVQRDAFVELWFDGLARVGVPRYGPFGLYATDVAPLAPGSPLERVAPGLRAAFVGDSTYDVLHFVALYFVGEQPDAVLGALRLALAPDAPPMEGRLASRAAAVAAALPTAAHRARVRAFVDALAEEWRVGERRGPDARTLAALQRRWDAEFGQALQPFLTHVGRERGVILPVAALGLEGRIVRLERGRTIVAVASPSPADTLTPLLAAVRELGFVLLDEAAVLGTRRDDRHAAQRQRDVAALRAGALLLDALAPSWAEPYRRRYAGAEGATADGFANAFPLPPATERALRAAVADAVMRHAGPRTH